MSSADLIVFVGYLISAWCIGFASGYTITKYKDAVSQIG